MWLGVVIIGLFCGPEPVCPDQMLVDLDLEGLGGL